MEKAEELCKTENKEGLKLSESFTYEKTLDSILEVIEKNSWQKDFFAVYYSFIIKNINIWRQN